MGIGCMGRAIQREREEASSRAVVCTSTQGKQTLKDMRFSSNTTTTISPHATPVVSYLEIEDSDNGQRSHETPSKSQVLRHPPNTVYQYPLACFVI